MITRDVAQLQVVPAFVHYAPFNSCTIDGYTCTEGSGQTSAIGDSGFMPGFVIDRLGLDQGYRSLLLAPTVYGQAVACSTATKMVMWAGLSMGLQHTSATGGTWANYSTGHWLVKQGLWRDTTATSTGQLYYTPVQADAQNSSEGSGGIMSSATSTAAGQSITAGTTSTGAMYYAGPGAFFDLGGAKRYVRTLIHLHHWSTVGSTDANGAPAFRMSASAIFGEPDIAAPLSAPIKRILVTTGCAT